MCEMMKIMQEYGEVTCCLGSSANLRNSCLFLQSDVRSGTDPGTWACWEKSGMPHLVIGSCRLSLFMGGFSLH